MIAKIGVRQYLGSRVSGGHPTQSSNSHPTVVFHNPTNPIELDLLYRMTVHNYKNKTMLSIIIMQWTLVRSNLNEEIDAFVLPVEYWLLILYLNNQ